MIDFARIEVKAGKGGAGKVGWRQNKSIRKGGPDGGNGGNGGSVYLVADPHLNTLKDFQFQKKFAADSGQMGGSNRRAGRAGADLILKVPVGTVVKDQKSNIYDLVSSGQRVCVARGGNGGRGNWVFRSPSLTTPKFADPGEPGETKTLVLELKLLADVGLIGLPNAGKSTLLSVLTQARPKIADYPFTTLEPNLGVLRLAPFAQDLVLADIPGLIEGASQGKGLGIEFLRHVERCTVLLHVLNGAKLIAGSDPAELIKDYLAIRQELGSYNKDLLAKKELVLLNKTDLLSEKQVKACLAKFKKIKIAVLPISAATGKNLAQLKFLIESVRA